MAPSFDAPAIATAGLTKSFGDTVVLDGIDLRVDAGTVFALLGPNGAGKTTTIHILTTLLAPDAGSAHVAGHHVVREADAVRRVIGVTGQFSAVDGLLTGEENLRLIADLHHLGRAEGRAVVDRLLERFDLTEAARRPTTTYSGGMRRRLDLAMTLVGRPQVIFLDEPTTGLDPRSRREVWDAVRELVADGVTIFLTTQYLEEADHLAHRLAVLDRGRIIAEGSPAELKRQAPGGGHILLQVGDAVALDAVAHAFASATVDPDALTAQVPSDGGIASLRSVLDELDRNAITVDALSVHTPDLDDVFLALTGHPQEQTP